MTLLGDTLAELTLALLKIPSETGSEGPIAESVLRRMETTTFGPRVLRHGNAVLTLPVADHRPVVALLGHLDTVPARQDGPPRREGNVIVGCGASDMKGALAVMLALAETLDPDSMWAQPMFVFYDREEGPYVENGLGPLLERFPETFARIRLGICMEPTSNAVEIGCLGTLHAHLTFHGQRCHSARPWEGKNAIQEAGSLLVDLAQRQPVDVWFGDLLYREVLSATMAFATGTRNVIPDVFALNLNYRFAPGKSLETAYQDVLDFVAGRAEVEFSDPCPSGPACLDNPLLKRFLTLSNVIVQAKQAWTDVARLGVHGIDAINFGPGDGKFAHQRNEQAPVDALEDAYHLLHRFFVEEFIA
ncbi:MAG: succinyl-diaminopimelate desuccinylase [Myxococcales bacterium]|nr:succinyl-diaminopimelate desuccinylase [Myxococcales bacterium]